MKRLTILLLLVFTSIAHAQEDTAPWPPDPSEIFAEGVEVVDMEIYDSSMDTPAEARQSFDNEARVVRVYDEEKGEWREFTYPDTVVELNYLQPRSDRTLLLFREYNDYGPAPDSAMLLNASTGEFISPDEACSTVASPPNEGRWISHFDTRVNRVALCNTETGEFIALLPANIEYAAASASPSGEWLVIWAKEDQLLHLIHLYAYEFATGTLNYLGDYTELDQNNIEQWIDDERAILYNGDMPSWSDMEYLAFNVTQPNSLHYVIDGRADYYENPSRYEYLQTYYGILAIYSVPGHPNCSLDLYFPFTEQYFSYVLGQDCFGVVEWGGGHYFYVSYATDGSSGNSLYQLNPFTGEMTVLAGSEEIIALESVSADGRYIVVGYGQDIPSYDELDPSHFDQPNQHLPFSEAAIFDSTTGQFIHVGVDWSSRTHWFADNRFWVWRGEAFDSNQTISVYEIDNGEISNFTVEASNTISSPSNNQQSLLLYDYGDMWNGARVLDLITGEITPVIRSGIAHYNSIASWTDGDSLYIRICPEGTDAICPSFVTYIIRLP